MNKILTVVFLVCGFLLSSVVYACWGPVESSDVVKNKKEFTVKMNCTGEKLIVSSDKILVDLKKGDIVNIKPAEIVTTQAKEVPPTATLLDDVTMEHGNYLIHLDYPKVQGCMINPKRVR